MNCVDVERSNGVLVAALNRGTINALNTALIAELERILKEVREDPEIDGLVLTSANDKFFSIGFALPELYPLRRDEFADFFRGFNHLCLTLYTIPKPTVTALTGHATAGGCILALCTDYRLAAAGNSRMGINESQLGVPVTYLAYRVLADLVGTRHARDAMYSGILYSPDDALAIGMIDKVVAAHRIRAASVAKAKDLASTSRQAFAADKGFRVRAIYEAVIAGLEEEESAFIDQWYAPEARELLGRALDKFQPRP